jgi:hypothetical protein
MSRRLRGAAGTRDSCALQLTRPAAQIKPSNAGVGPDDRLSMSPNNHPCSQAARSKHAVLMLEPHQLPYLNVEETLAPPSTQQQTGAAIKHVPNAPAVPFCLPPSRRPIQLVCSQSI